MRAIKNYGFPLLILISTILGSIAGLLFENLTHSIEPLGTLFLRLLFMLVPALVFFSIASSFSNIGSPVILRQWGGRIVGWFLTTTIIAAIIGIIFGLIFKPGRGLTVEDTDLGKAEITADNFIAWIPENAFGALSAGNIVQIVILAIIIGFAVVLMKDSKEKDFLILALNSGQSLFVTVTKYVMYYAPIGIFALVAKSIASFEDSLLSEMGSFLTAYTLAFITQVVLVYLLLFWIVTRLNPFQLTKKIFPAIMTAFGTVSSAATMPITLNNTIDAGVDKDMADFGIPLGVTFHMDSMALEIPLYIMLGMYAIGLDPSFTDLILFVFFGIVFSIGTAGVPGGGIAIATILVGAFNLPIDIVAWIAAVFIYLDVTGTVMNIWGDAVCTTIVAHQQNKLDINMYHS